ncbi:glycosyltransferase [Leptolyngbya sp. AN02str]|uniref:glycosyltransferase n=1 Tax=Leptolyngbya sp. AN02str TaxID=3423363 RepID=UPI003D317668
MTNMRSQPSPSNPSEVAASQQRSNVPTRQAIAIISADADPAIDTGKQEAGERNIYVRRIAEALCKLGWQVDIFTRKNHPDQPKIVEHSPYCRTIRLKAGPEALIPRDQRFEIMPEFLEEFLKVHSKEHYPLVHTSYWTSGWVGMQLKQHHNLQHVHTYHSLGILKYPMANRTSAIAQTRIDVERQILEAADCIVATSPQEQEALQMMGSPKGIFEVIPGGADVDVFRAMPQVDARLKLGFDLSEHLVLYVGRFDPRKGLKTLVESVARLIQQPGAALTKPVRLVIVGGEDPAQESHEERQYIGNLVEELGLSDRVLFVGQVGHDVLPLYYTAADVCAVPSHFEPFGLVALEAMSCGTPVVASDVGGLKFTIVPEETGLLVPPDDVDALANAIERVLTDQVWAQKLKRQASARVQQNFSWTGVAARLSDLYRRLLAQSITHELLWDAIEPSSANGTQTSSVLVEPTQVRAG